MHNTNHFFVKIEIIVSLFRRHPVFCQSTNPKAILIIHPETMTASIWTFGNKTNAQGAWYFLKFFYIEIVLGHFQSNETSIAAIQALMDSNK